MASHVTSSFSPQMSHVTPMSMIVQGAQMYVSHVTSPYSRQVSDVTPESMIAHGAERHVTHFKPS